MLNNFNLEKPFDLYLDRPTSTHPPLCRITQQGKQPILTTDFYIKPKEWIPPTPPTNNNSTLEAAAASANTPEIPADPLQPEVRLHSWQLFAT